MISTNSTVPVGDIPVTMAVRVIGCVVSGSVGDTLRVVVVVVVSGVLTVTLVGCEALLVKPVVSLRYFATIACVPTARFGSANVAVPLTSGAVPRTVAGVVDVS